MVMMKDDMANDQFILTKVKSKGLRVSCDNLNTQFKWCVLLKPKQNGLDKATVKRDQGGDHSTVAISSGGGKRGGVIDQRGKKT